MVFQFELAELIRSRRKVQFRRPVRIHPVSGKLEKSCPYQEGQLYAVQSTRAWTIARLRRHRAVAEALHPTRARAVVAYLTGPVEARHQATTVFATGLHITVLAIDQQRLGDLSREDLHREGFRFAEEFRAHWQNRYGHYDPEQLVWVVTFAVGDHRERFDRPRLLRANPNSTGAEQEGVDEHQDYTDRPDLAMRSDPGEALSRREQEALSVLARQRDARARADAARKLAERSSAERLAEIQWHRAIGRG